MFKKKYLILSLLFPALVVAQSTTSLPFAFRFFCSLAPIVGSSHQNCIVPNDVSVADVIQDPRTVDALSQKVKDLENKIAELNKNTITQTIATQPETVIRYIAGPKGDPGTPGVTTVVNQQTVAQSPVQPTNLQAFGGITQPFWGGAGAGPVTNTTIIQGSSLPSGGLFNQVLTINASGTPEWITPVVGTSSSSTTLAWSLTGNTGTDSNVNFIGTTDAQDLVFKTNNGTSGILYASGNSVVFGRSAGSFTNPQGTVFIGGFAGDDSGTIFNSVAIGANSARNINGSNGVVFIGGETGYAANNSSNTVAIGRQAAYSADNSPNSVFIGFQAGDSARGVSFSNAIGYQAGAVNNQASYSNFFGYKAGNRAFRAANSIFIGNNAGLNDTVNNTATTSNTSILIGDNTRTGGFSRSIAIGFNAVNTSGNQFLVAPIYTQFSFRGINYFMPTSFGGPGSVLTDTTGTGFLSWVAASTTGSFAYQNGLTAGTSTIKLGGFLNEPTDIGVGNHSFMLSSGALAVGINPPQNVSFRFGSTTRILSPGFKVDEFFSGTIASSTTDSNTSYSGLVTAQSGSTLIGGGSESYFDSLNLKVGNDGNTYSNRINNASHGSVISNIVYATTSSTVIRRSFFQALDDGRANIRATRPVAGSRAEMEFLPDGGTFINTFTATSSVRVDLFPHTGLQFSNGLGANYFFPLTNGASGTVMTMGAGGQIAFNSIPSLIANAGNISIGTSSPLARLHIFEPSTNPVARFENTDGYCEIDPTTTSLICTSDKTLKKDITEIPNTLSLFSQLRPVTYHWNTQSDTDPFSYGLIAQEVEALYPTLVFTDPHTNIKTLSYGSLLPITIQAVKDLNTALGDITATSTTPESFSTSTIFKKILASLEWMGVKISNGLAEFKTVKTERLCVGETCLTEDQVQKILQQIENASGTMSPVSEIVPEVFPIASSSTTSPFEVVEDLLPAETIAPEPPIEAETPTTETNSEEGTSQV